ncbi:hypothetical protein LI154_13300 [[Clostridium] scindens]|uniref:hypothetical protein n=1 Tax=Clostridium scindens (strain JCM 10418 / VPI 12708) TaxID=29347 RepID=UPI001D093277|nr:hypothetical protein [[Clostridium] scindens]MCB6646211.1 hypothetical protein [[Clostridium] scindens]
MQIYIGEGSLYQLPTANKVLKKDIVVQKVPYFETSNNYDGVTVYIAEEVNQNA